MPAARSILAVSALATAAVLGPSAPAQRALSVHDLSESGEAMRFLVDPGAGRVEVALLAAARWDVLELEVRGAAVGTPLLFEVPGAAGRVWPVVTEGGFAWREATVLSGGRPEDLRFAVLPRRPRLVVRLARPGRGGLEAPYYTHARFAQYLAAIAHHPRAQVTQVGTSIQGRPLYRVLVDVPPGSRKKTVLMAVRQHGDEDASSYVVEGVLDLLLGRNGLTPNPDLLRRVRWIVYPMMNPDGAVARMRGNANGVDLNRDWDRGGCNAGQQPETMAFQCDLEALHARFGVTIGGDHHGWGNPNHGGFRYAEGQSVSFVSAPEHQEARKDTTVITRHDPTQLDWQENGGTTGMLRAEMFLRFGFLIHTPEYNSAISTEAEFHQKGQRWAAAMLDTLFAPRFTDAVGHPTRIARLGDPIWVTVDDDDENLSTTVRETVRVGVLDHTTGDEEALLLTETGPNTGVFRNTTGVPLVGGAAVPGNGVLESAAPSVVIASYRDDDYPRDQSQALLEVLPQGAR